MIPDDIAFGMSGPDALRVTVIKVAAAERLPSPIAPRNDDVAGPGEVLLSVYLQCAVLAEGSTCHGLDWYMSKDTLPIPIVSRLLLNVPEPQYEGQVGSTSAGSVTEGWVAAAVPATGPIDFVIAVPGDGLTPVAVWHIRS